MPIIGNRKIKKQLGRPCGVKDVQYVLAVAERGGCQVNKDGPM